ncbi:MAG: hypothetical protein KA747_07930, partial [Ignavibacteriaceae bacterium]|nr:hypothetical protein [Ignavibacteriaceae bacterium]
VNIVFKRVYSIHTFYPYMTPSGAKAFGVVCRLRILIPSGEASLTGSQFINSYCRWQSGRLPLLTLTAVVLQIL